MTARKLKGNIQKLFLITFSNSLIFAYVIERIFAQERGLSILEMQYILIIYALVSLLLEIPCGVLADKWKKKYVLAIALFFCSLEFFISIFAYSFTVFSLAFLAAAVGGSLKSGTLESIFFQTLKDLKKANEYERLMGYLKFLKYGSQSVIAIIGGYIADHTDLVVNYWLSLIGFPISILIALSLYETKNIGEERSYRSTSFYSHLRISLGIVRRDPSLMRVIVYSGITSAVLYGELHEMSSLVYPEIGISVSYFGYVSFIATLLGGLSGIVSARLKDRLGYNKSFKYLLLGSIPLIGLFGWAQNWWDVVYLLLAIFLMEMIPPLTSGYTQQRIEDQYRVTISSLDSFMKNGLAMLVGLLFGYISDQFSIFVGFQTLSAMLALYAILYILTDSKKIETS